MDFSGDFQRPTITAEVRDAVDKATNKIQRSPRLPLNRAETYVPGKDGKGRLTAWLSAVDALRLECSGDMKAARILLDTSIQGSGKSHTVRKFARVLMNHEHSFDPAMAPNGFIYVSSSFRSPSIPEIEKYFKEIPTRHQGLVHVQGPEGSMIRRTITAQELKDGVTPDEPATCAFAQRLNALSSRGYSYQEATESFCHNRCPYRPIGNFDDGGFPGDGSCPHRRNSDHFWLKERDAEEPVPMARFIRCSIQGLAGIRKVCPGYLEFCTIFIDESDQLIEAALEVHDLSKKKLGDLISFLPAQFMDGNEQAMKLTESLLTQLLQLLGQVESPHGIDHHQVRSHLRGWIKEVVDTYKGKDGMPLPVQWSLNNQTHLTRADDFSRAVLDQGFDQMDSLPSPLLPRLVHCVLGEELGEEFAGYCLSVTKYRKGSAGATKDNYRITLTSPSGLPQAIARGSDVVVVGDATADADLMRKIFETPGYPIAMKQVKAVVLDQSQQADTLFFQTKDLGGMTMRRGDHQKERLIAIRAGAQDWAGSILGIDRPLVGFIEHKDLSQPGDGQWHTATARGGNMFQDHDALVLIGKPIKNVSAALSEYVSLTGDAAASTGCSAEENSPAFIKYQAQLIAAEIQQALGRLRAVRRKGKKLVILFVSDVDLSAMPIDVVQVKASDITPKAAHKTEQKLEAITEAILQLASDGLPVEKISTRKVAKTAGVGETTVRRIAQHQTEGKPWPVFVNSVLKEAIKEDSP